MEGEQRNTYDINFYGPNTMMGMLYLGALTAAAKMARHLGEDAVAEGYERLARSGGAKLDQLLFSGEYYIQTVDETNPTRANINMARAASRINRSGSGSPRWSISAS